MLANALFSDIIVPLKTSDTGSNALSMMEEMRVSHLPVVNCEKLLGVISDADIYNLGAPDEPLGNHALSLMRPYVMHYHHYYEVIRVAATEQLTLVPVLDDKENYLGCITLSRIIALMADMASVKQPGGVIVLEVSDQDYSLAEIARIVESNDAKILSSYITSYPETTRLEVTIKVNRIDLSAIIQTFNRYNYLITASFSEESQRDELLNSRYEQLMNYLNV
jgi:acetoin utilization protein AcuB